MKRKELDTTKVVISTCYGGFGLSSEAMVRYGELKGIKVYPDGEHLFFTYWTVSPEERKAAGYVDEMKKRLRLTGEQRDFNNSFYRDNTISSSNFDRADPILVQVVEELGSEKASSQFARLEIVELTKGTRYKINEYDGNESIETDESWSEWSVA